jgi:hypothetical protein
MDFLFYLVIVKKAAAEENEDLMTSGGVGTNPKFYLKPVTVMPLDTFACTHGPYTEVNGKLFITLTVRLDKAFKL